jgi:hypothetical protein
VSPPPREREESNDNHEEPHHHHPQHGVESHEVAAAARLRPEVVPAPSAVVGGFVVFTRDYTGANRGTDVRLFC